MQASALFILTLPTFPTSNCHKHILTSLILVYPFVQHLDTSIQWKFATIAKNFADVYAYKNFFYTKNHDYCPSTNNNKTKEWTPPDGRNQFIDSFVNRAISIFYRAYLTIPDLTSRLINKQLSKTCPPILILWLRKQTKEVPSLLSTKNTA